MSIDESWVNDSLETLELLGAYGENGTRYEDTQVVNMLADMETDGNTSMAEPRIQLLSLLRNIDVAWVRDSK
jgi:hypothetical protein